MGSNPTFATTGDNRQGADVGCKPTALVHVWFDSRITHQFIAPVVQLAETRGLSLRQCEFKSHSAHQNNMEATTGLAGPEPNK